MYRSCVSTALRKTERLVTRHYDSYLERAGVTAVQLPILAFISGAEQPTLRGLTEQFELDRSTLSRNLALLERDGFLVLGPSSGPKPGRLTLTRKGRAALRRGAVKWREAHNALLAASGASSVDAGMDFLKRLRRSVR